MYKIEYYQLPLTEEKIIENLNLEEAGGWILVCIDKYNGYYFRRR